MAGRVGPVAVSEVRCDADALGGWDERFELSAGHPSKIISPAEWAAHAGDARADEAWPFAGLGAAGDLRVRRFDRQRRRATAEDHVTRQRPRCGVVHVQLKLEPDQG